MRFLMLNWRDPRNPLAGGAERVTLAYWSALARRGHEAVWFTNRFPGSEPEETIDGVSLIRDGGIGSSILKARSWCSRQSRFDLVVDQHHGIPWLAPWWSGTRCVAYVHEVLGPIWNTFYQWPWNWIGQTQERWAHWLYRNVPFWTACESTRDPLRRHGARDIRIIRYGVQTEAIPELDVKPLTTPLDLVVVCRLAPNKRVDHAIRAVDVLRARGVPARLTIIGSGVSEPDLRRQTAALHLEGSVTFKGALSEADKDAALRRAHFLLHTSQREGWGLNVIEANAMGTPAAVYPVPGLVESTLHNQTGLVSAGETPDALAAGLAGVVLAPDEYQKYRRNAWERAKLFHWDRILPEACDWLEGMAAGKNQTHENPDRP